MKKIIQNLETTQKASSEMTNYLSENILNDAAKNISFDFQNYLLQAKQLFKDLNRLENEFQQIKKTQDFQKSFLTQKGEFSTFQFVQSGKKDFEDNFHFQHFLMNIKNCLIKAFTFTEDLKKKITNHKEQYIVGMGGNNNIVGILELEEIIKSTSLALDKDGQTLKLMIGQFDVLQKSIQMSNQKLSEELQNFHKIVLTRFYFILNTFKSMNKGKTEANKVHISAGYIFEVAIKSLKYDRLKKHGFENLSPGAILAFYQREKSNVPYFREGDINDVSALQQYLKEHPDLMAEQYSVKMVMSENQAYGPSLVTIKTLNSVLLSVIYILSSNLSETGMKKILFKQVFSTETSKGHLDPEKIKDKLKNFLSDTVVDILEKELGIK